MLLRYKHSTISNRCLELILLAPPHSVRRIAFSTGFAFIYWDRHCVWDDDDELRKIEEEMSVTPKHQTLKEEILGSGYLTGAQWHYLVELKVREYMKTENVRKMVKWDGVKKMHYSVTKDHIRAIMLYCDFAVLCTAFSATFRREHVFESLESVKQRHSQFAIFGRLLVELIFEFGTNGLPHEPYGGANEKGPFFCGLNRIMNVGSFAITLKGPCSTSAVQ